MKLLCVDGNNCAYVNSGSIYDGILVDTDKYRNGKGYKIKKLDYIYDTSRFKPISLSNNIKVL